MMGMSDPVFLTFVVSRTVGLGFFYLKPLLKNFKDYVPKRLNMVKHCLDLLRSIYKKG